MSQLRVSVAVPLFNEEENLPELLSRLGAVLESLPGGPHEIVLVDDGSTDRTWELMEVAAKGDDRITAISLSRNFGHQAALSAALDHVSGSVTAVMDGDLQDTPEEIPRFLEAFDEGYDVVYATRHLRKEPAWLRACYWTYYRMLARLARPALPVDAGDFALLSRRVVDEIRRAPERQRYLRGLRAWVGFRQLGLPVERASRHAGKSKYSLWRLVGLGLDGVFAFSTIPIRVAALLGFAALAMTSTYGLYALYAKVALGRSPEGFTALLFVMSFMTGVLLFFLGIIGEYVGRIYEEVKARPLYVVGRLVNGKSRQR